MVLYCLIACCFLSLCPEILVESDNPVYVCLFLCSLCCCYFGIVLLHALQLSFDMVIFLLVSSIHLSLLSGCPPLFKCLLNLALLGPPVGRSLVANVLPSCFTVVISPWLNNSCMCAYVAADIFGVEAL